MTISRNRYITTLCLLACFSVVHISSASLELDLLIGFDGRFRPGSSIPVTMTVRSTGAPLDADLILEYVAGTALEQGPSWTWVRPVSLVPDVTGVFRFSLPLEASSYPLTARLERHGITLASVETELRPAITDRPMVIGLSERPSLDSALPSLNRRLGRSTSLLYPRVEHLPVYPASWNGVDLVIWHQLSFGDLDLLSLEALGLWVAGGGRLVVIGNTRLSGLDFPDALPFGRIGGPSLDGERVIYPISGVGGIDGETFTDSSVRFLPYGLGEMAYIPFDIASTSLPIDQREALWDDLLSGFVSFRVGEPDSLVNLITDSALTRDVPLLPGVPGPLIIGGVFAAAVMVVLLLGRRIDSPGSRRTTLLVLTVLGAAASLAATRYRHPLETRRLELHISRNFGSVNILERFRFASPIREKRDIPLPPMSLPSTAEPHDIKIEWTPSGSIIAGWTLEPWTSSELSIRTTAAGYDVGSKREGNRGEWRNNGHEDLLDPVLLSGGQAMYLAANWGPGEWLSEGSGTEWRSENTADPVFSSMMNRLIKDLGTDTSVVVARMHPDPADRGKVRLALFLGEDR